MPIFTDKEIKSIITVAEDSKIKYVSLISIATGMRKGEVLGLKESDINYVTNEIIYEKNCSYYYYI